MNTYTIEGKKVERIQTAEQRGDTTVRKEAVITTEAVNAHDLYVARLIDLVWLVVAVIEIVVSLRFVLLFFGAGTTNFTQAIYSLSEPFVAPFYGIFAAVTEDGFYVETASLVALAIWLMVGYVVTYVISLFSQATSEEE